MGRVIIKLRGLRSHYFESYKCKSLERAKQIAGKYRNLIEWNFYEDYQSIPSPPKKKVKEQKEMTLDELEKIISRF